MLGKCTTLSGVVTDATWRNLTAAGGGGGTEDPEGTIIRYWYHQYFFLSTKDRLGNFPQSVLYTARVNIPSLHVHMCVY